MQINIGIENYTNICNNSIDLYKNIPEKTMYVLNNTLYELINSNFNLLIQPFGLMIFLSIALFLYLMLFFFLLRTSMRI